MDITVRTPPPGRCRAYQLSPGWQPGNSCELATDWQPLATDWQLTAGNLATAGDLVTFGDPLAT
eukprot:3268877-Prymnesium_polylepis.1